MSHQIPLQPHHQDRAAQFGIRIRKARISTLHDRDEFPVFPKVQQTSPALARSCCSMDLSNFKKTDIIATRHLRRLARGSSSISSILSLGSPETCQFQGSVTSACPYGLSAISSDSTKENGSSQAVVSSRRNATAVGGDSEGDKLSAEQGTDFNRLSVAT